MSGHAARVGCSGRGRKCESTQSPSRLSGSASGILDPVYVAVLHVFDARAVVVLVLVVVSRVLHILISAMQSHSQTIIPMSMLHIQSRGPLCHSRSHCCNHCQCPFSMYLDLSTHIRCQCLSMLHIQSRGPLCHSRSHCCNHCQCPFSMYLDLSTHIRCQCHIREYSLFTSL